MRPIENFKDYYITSSGEVWSIKRKKFLKPGISHGYLQVSLSKGNKKHTKKIHRLVLEAFVGPCPDGMETCHNNDVKTDNRLENLRWDTHLANTHDAINHNKHPARRTGLRAGGPSGEQHYRAKLTEEQVKVIFHTYHDGAANQYELAAAFNVGQDEISKIVNKKTWKHIWR